MARLQLIGVDFDSGARGGSVADAATELRRLGLVDRLVFRHDVLDWGELIAPAPVAQRSEVSGLLNEEPLIVMTRRLRDAVGYGLAEGAIPVVYGADCAVLLGALAGARDALGEIGLMSVDGHEDLLDLGRSPDGRASGSVLALVLGLTGESAPTPLRELLPLARAERLALLGQRQRQELAEPALASLRERPGRMAFRASADEVRAAAPAACGREGALVAAGADDDLRAGRPGARAGRWWLHIDLDVLDAGAFPALDYLAPGGLSWQQLLTLVSAALGVRGCCGVSLVAYDPELDPDLVAGRLLVDFADRLAALLP
jgi:arginase